MDFAEFANQKSENRRRLIFPRLPSARGPGVEPVARRLFGWVISGRETWSTSPAHSTAGPKQGHKSLSRYIYMLRSHHATFAFRIACAVLCSQLPACLRQTQAWYNAQRVVWTSITVSMSAASNMLGTILTFDVGRCRHTSKAGSERFQCRLSNRWNPRWMLAQLDGVVYRQVSVKVENCPRMY